MTKQFSTNTYFVRDCHWSSGINAHNDGIKNDSAPYGSELCWWRAASTFNVEVVLAQYSPIQALSISSKIPVHAINAYVRVQV